MARSSRFIHHAITATFDWARDLKRDIAALWIAARDARTPWPSKLLAGMVVAYALSPVDLIPDFIPVIGYLDDLIIVPLGLWIAIKMMPAELLTEFRRRAVELGPRARSLVGLFLVGAIWLVAAAFLFHGFCQYFAVTTMLSSGV